MPSALRRSPAARARRRRPCGPAVEPLAPQHHDLARAPRRRPRRAAAAPARSSSAGSLPAARASAPSAALVERGRQRGREGRARAGRVAHAQGRARLERARLGRGDGELQAVAAHALAQAQVEDRRVVDGLGVEHEHDVGELEVGGAAPAARARRARDAARAAAHPPRRESMCGEPSALAQQPREQQALLVGALPPPASAPVAAPARAAAPLAACSSARSQGTGRSWPPSRTSGSVMRSSTWKDW